MRRMRVRDSGLLLAHDNRWELSFDDVATVSLGVFAGRVTFSFFCIWALTWFSYGIYPIEAR
jgi:hypothetical protein